MDTNALSQVAFVMLVQRKFDSANERTNYMNLGRERTSARTPQIASERKEKADSALRSSQAVPHPSTDHLHNCIEKSSFLTTRLIQQEAVKEVS